MKRVMVLVLLALAVGGCRKKPDPVAETPVPTTGKMDISFQQMAGAEKLELNTGWYKNANGDSLQFKTFNYFISNIKLTRTDGTVHTDADGYYLIIGSAPSTHTITLSNIPPGMYKSISFLIGVDSARNVSGAQTGALDQSSGMFWDWKTGYIMAKLEGKSPQSSVSKGGIMYHMGGFSGANSSLRTVTLDFSGANVETSKTPNLHLFADALEWFKTPNTIKVAETSVIMSDVESKLMADNYADMFTVDHID